MNDIQTREDIILLVNQFYNQILTDDLVGVFFTEVVQLNWDEHIPVIHDFWESTLFGKASYKGNPMLKHLALSRKKKMKPSHFDRWLLVWEQTIKANFEGKIAESAIQKAKQIAELMKYKIEQQTWFE